MKEKLKKLWRSLLNPPKWTYALIITLAVAVIAFTVLTLVLWQDFPAVLSYLLYALSALLLTYATYLVVKLAPRVKSMVIIALNRHAVTKKMLDNYGFRTLVFAFFSLLINLAYAALNVVLAFIIKRYWYVLLGVYYLLLTVNRAMIIAYQGGKRKRKKHIIENDEITEQNRAIKRYILSGAMLSAMPLVLSGIIALVIIDGRLIGNYGGLMIYAAATYTTYKVAASIYNLVKSSRADDMTVRAVRSIGLADAAVSLFALQTALTTAFGSGGNATFIGTILTGAAVCAITLTLGVIMLVYGNKKLKENYQKENNENE